MATQSLSPLGIELLGQLKQGRQEKQLFVKVGFRNSCNVLIDEFSYILVKVCYLVVLYDLKRAGDNETEAVNALPCVVEEVPWGTEQQLLDQAQAGCESLLVKDDEVQKKLCWKCG